MLGSRVRFLLVILFSAAPLAGATPAGDRPDSPTATRSTGGPAGRDLSAIVPVRSASRHSAATFAFQDAAVSEPTDGGSPDVLAQMLREGFELLDDGEIDAALAAMQKAVVRAGADDLPALEALTRDVRGAALAELLAQTRFEAALRQSERRAFEIRFATRYERVALGRVLERAVGQQLQRVFLGRTVAELTVDPASITELPPAARELERAARLAAAMISARLRHDPWLGGLPGERQAQVALRERLTRLAAHVAALPGFTGLGQDAAAHDPTRDAAQRLAEEARAASQPADEPDEADKPSADAPAPSWPRRPVQP